ncbi:glycoside hydrolase family 2 protein [candidate division KSB1 bacterium]|nr:glycoside hydrolase family 2 protein [candidate division KSB1 bacterium]
MNQPLIKQIAFILSIAIFTAILTCSTSTQKVRVSELFTANWKFHLGDVPGGQETALDDSAWRVLDLPHDWSIEGEFSDAHPATPGGGALPGGIGWYRKHFTVPETSKEVMMFIEFDGVYRNSEVWLNGHYLGKRPYGYSSFRYELTPFLNFGETNNILAVRVDNSKQPNSRWYSGSGIYRNVRLVTVGKMHVDHWGTFITTPLVTEDSAQVSIQTRVRNATEDEQSLMLKTVIINQDSRQVAVAESEITLPQDASAEFVQEVKIDDPALWSLDDPSVYTAITTIERDGKACDNYETTFGIRTFEFDSEKGFFLNGKSVKINGVCNHHDLGCLGAAINARALERQLEILQEMGCNGVRTSHNPPAPELLDLCDRMGFIVMDEAFDMWKKKKTEFDYALDWDEWHRKDLEAMVLRDRNHPSVFMWSIGNEVLEQWDEQDSSGIHIARELACIIRELDTTRPITAACNGPVPTNPVIKSGALDLIGYNYHHNDFPSFPQTFPGGKFIATETVSSLATRGYYDMPSDLIHRWPTHWDIPFTFGNPDNTCSAYDNCSTPWGSTQEETWKIMKKHEFLSGQYIWTGFDYLGEPTPYGWPSRSSYFGIIDLAGFPKDTYYMYQSEWTDKQVLHIFPNRNWAEGDTIDVWVYTSEEEVELFLNDTSLGAKTKQGDDLHLMWRLAYLPGTLTGIARTNGKEILTKKVMTAGAPAKIVLSADRDVITADGKDLSFITVKVVDEYGTLVPYADNLIHFEIEGEGFIAGVDNGCQTSHEPFRANYRKAFNGLCLVVVQTTETSGSITLTAKSIGIEGASISLKSR